MIFLLFIQSRKQPHVLILGLSGNIVAIYFARRQREWIYPVPADTPHAKVDTWGLSEN